MIQIIEYCGDGKDMNNKALLRSLKTSIAAVICLTVFVFSLLGAFIHNMCEGTIEEIGTDYMS